MFSTQDPKFSPDEYLQIEEQSPIKHEYLDGQLYAMVGASQNHNTIALNLASVLRRQMRGSACRVFISDIKVRIEQRNRFYYPDLAVTCDERDRETPLYLRFPRLLVEVLSDSTEDFDRGEKFQDYQTLKSLCEYVLVSSKQPLVQCFRRNDSGFWALHTYSCEQESFHFSSLDFTGTFEALYEDVLF